MGWIDEEGVLEDEAIVVVDVGRKEVLESDEVVGAAKDFRFPNGFEECVDGGSAEVVLVLASLVWGVLSRLDPAVALSLALTLPGVTGRALELGPK